MQLATLNAPLMVVEPSLNSITRALRERRSHAARSRRRPPVDENLLDAPHALALSLSFGYRVKLVLGIRLNYRVNLKFLGVLLTLLSCSLYAQ